MANSYRLTETIKTFTNSDLGAGDVIYANTAISTARTVTLPAGQYLVEVRGARGGGKTVSSSSSWSTTSLFGNAGKGRYISFRFNLPVPTMFKYTVGGTGTTVSTASSVASGGTNGGGAGRSSSGAYNIYGSSGGGYTALWFETVDLTNASTLIACAGGGGGCACSGMTSLVPRYPAFTTDAGSATPVNTTGLNPVSWQKGIIGYTASQSSCGSHWTDVSTSSTSTRFQGGRYNYTDRQCAGGGGGLYGGSASYANGSNYNVGSCPGGGGGSSYLFTKQGWTTPNYSNHAIPEYLAAINYYQSLVWNSGYLAFTYTPPDDYHKDFYIKDNGIWRQIREEVPKLDL